MIFKFTGIIIFVYICIKASYDLKNILKNRYVYVGDIINGLNYLKKEISFFSTLLGEALVNSGEYAGAASVMFIKAGSEIIKNPACNPGDIFETEIKVSDLRLCAIMKEFGSQLGTGDTENEVIVIESVITKLMIIYDEFFNEYKTKENIITKIGIISGIFISILII